MSYNRTDIPSIGTRMSQNDAEAGFELRHAGSRRLFEYWSDLRGGRAAPYKSEVTARGVGRALAGNTFILERLSDGAMRFRLAGSRLFDVFGLEVRGMSALSIMDGDSRTRFRSLVEECLAGPAVGAMTCIANTPDGEEITLEIILAPLRSDFDQMNRVLGGVHVLDQEQDEIETAPRRCRITAAHTLSFEDGERGFEIDGPVAGFAEEQAPFEMDRPALKPIEGGAPSGERRRGHLKLVED